MDPRSFFSSIVSKLRDQEYLLIAVCLVLLVFYFSLKSDPFLSITDIVILFIFLAIIFPLLYCKFERYAYNFEKEKRENRNQELQGATEMLYDHAALHSREYYDRSEIINQNREKLKPIDAKKSISQLKKFKRMVLNFKKIVTHINNTKNKAELDKKIEADFSKLLEKIRYEFPEVKQIISSYTHYDPPYGFSHYDTIERTIERLELFNGDTPGFQKGDWSHDFDGSVKQIDFAIGDLKMIAKQDN